MTERVMTDRLVERVLGWHAAPDRFMTGARGWIRRSGFRPFTEISHALRLADKLTHQYSLTATPAGFAAEVRYRDRIGRATAKDKARAITLAVAQAIDLDQPASPGPKPRPEGVR